MSNTSQKSVLEWQEGDKYYIRTPIQGKAYYTVADYRTNGKFTYTAWKCEISKVNGKPSTKSIFLKVNCPTKDDAKAICELDYLKYLSQ